MIIDTDCGFDDFIAMKAIDESKSANIQLITSVAGIQDRPSRATTFLQQTFQQAYVATGSDAPSSNKPTPEWLIEYRIGLNDFMSKESGPTKNGKGRKKYVEFDQDDVLAKYWNEFMGNNECEPINNGTDLQEDEESDQDDVLAKYLNTSKDESIDLMCIGPLTNIARWVTSKSIGPLIQRKVKSVWIMGGNIPQQDVKDDSMGGGEEEKSMSPEFNFEADPSAAEKVLSSPLVASKIIIVPAQTCIDILPNNKTWASILDLSKSRNGVISNILKYDNSYGHIKYDPLTAFAYAHPEKIQTEKMKVEVNPSSGLISLVKIGPDLDDVHPINFVTHVEHLGDDGFLSWLCKIVEKETKDV